MGKRRKTNKKAMIPKKVYKTPKYFACPFCLAKDGISITMNKKQQTADLECRACSYSNKDIDATLLLTPLDVYDYFMDKTRLQNKRFNANQGSNSNESESDNESFNDNEGNKRQSNSESENVESGDLSEKSVSDSISSDEELENSSNDDD